MSCSHSLHTLPLVYVYLLAPAFNPHVPQVVFFFSFSSSHVHVQYESQPLQINTGQQKKPIHVPADCDSTTQPDHKSLLFLPASPLLSSHPGLIKAPGSVNGCDSRRSCLRTDRVELWWGPTIWWGNIEIAAVLTHQGSVVTASIGEHPVC